MVEVRRDVRRAGRMTSKDEQEQDLRIELMQAKLDNTVADTALKNEQRRWEPWKALSAAFGAGLAVATGLIALATWIIAHLAR
jgi:hypothetical protein